MTSKPRVLLVCYYFPPMGGAGIGRPLSLFKQLGEYGFDCDILTVKPVTYRVYEPEHLATLDKSKIYRSGSFDPQRFMYLLGVRKIKVGSIERGRDVSDRFFPDPKVGWVQPAVRFGRQLLASQKYDLIMSTSPPVSAHLVAQKLSRETSIPWVADFRDFWNSYPVEECFTDEKLVKKGKALLKSIRSEAKFVTTVNKTIADYLGTEHVIANSYDRDFSRLWLPEVKTNKFVIGLFGTFNEIYPVRPLFKLLSDLFDQHPEVREKIRIEQFGNCDKNWLIRQLEEFGLSDLCLMHGFKPRAEAVKAASDASCFYVGLASDREAPFTTGKVYYMLASGRPILAAVPNDGELSQLLKKTGNSLCYDPAHAQPATDFLLQKLQLFEQGDRTFTVCPEYSQEYSSDRMTSDFAALFAKLLSS